MLVAVALAVVATMVLPLAIVASRPDRQPPAAAATPLAASSCTGRPDHDDLADGEVAWVRLCPVAEHGHTQAAAVPDGAVLGQRAAALFAEWRLRSAREAGCRDDWEGQRLRIRVGFADGTVQEFTGRTSGCLLAPTPPAAGDQAVAGGDFAYREILMQTAQGLADDYADAAPAGPVRCPARPGVLDQDADGASAQLLSGIGLILALPAVEATVCSYHHGGLTDRTVLGAAEAESLRLTLHSDVSWGSVADCAVDPARASYVVTLADRTGTRRGFAIDGPACHALVTSGVRPDGYSDFGLAYALATELRSVMLGASLGRSPS